MCSSDLFGRFALAAIYLVFNRRHFLHHQSMSHKFKASLAQPVKVKSFYDDRLDVAKLEDVTQSRHTSFNPYQVFEMSELSLQNLKHTNYCKVSKSEATIIMKELEHGMNYMKKHRTMYDSLKAESTLTSKATTHAKTPDFRLSEIIQIPLRLYLRNITPVWHRSARLATRYATPVFTCSRLDLNCLETLTCSQTVGHPCS